MTRPRPTGQRPLPRTMACNQLAGLSVRCTDGTVVRFVAEPDDDDPTPVPAAPAGPRPNPPARRERYP